MTTIRKVIPAGTSPRTLPEILAVYERMVIIQALQLNDCSRERTAASLGISERNLYRRLVVLKIDMVAVTRGRSGRSKTDLDAEEQASFLSRG